MTTVAPGRTQLPPNVTIVANGRGDIPSSYRARALETGHRKGVSKYNLNVCKVAAFGRDVLLSGSA